MGFLAVFGHTNIDMLATVKRLPAPDESMAFEGPVRALGGTAANIAVVAARLGTPTCLVSHVGLDFPPAFRAQLQRAGIDTRHFIRVKGAPTPVCWIFSDPQGKQVCFINQGAAKFADRSPVPMRAVRAARVVHLATGSPKHHFKVALLAKRLGRQIAFDPGQELSYVWSPSTFRRMLRFADTLFLNDAERRKAFAYLHIRRAADLLDFVDEVILTHGASGSQHLSRDGEAHVAALRGRRVVNTTGAGDAFRGGYYAALYRGLPIKDRLRWGNAAASFVIESHSGTASAPTPRTLSRRLASERASDSE